MNYEPDNNKNLIQDLLNEKDEKKRKEFENLFNLNFMECLEHFRGSKSIPGLFGMHLFEQACAQFENYDDYKDYKIFLEYYTKYFEEIIKSKKHRKRN